MKLKVLGSIVVAAALAGAATSLATLQNGSQMNLGIRNGEPATVIQEGEMSEKQRQHSKLFKHPGPKLQDIAATRQGDVEVEQGEPFIIRLSVDPPKVPVFQSAVCNVDAVLVGSIVDSSSQLTEGGEFVFTEYEVAVEDVIKNNKSSPIQANSAITTIRDGGAVILNGRKLHAKNLAFDPPTSGKRYLLFLRFIPETGSYLMYGNGTFQSDGDNIIALGPGSRDELSSGSPKSWVDFLDDVRAFSIADCPSK